MSERSALVKTIMEAGEDSHFILIELVSQPEWLGFAAIGIDSTFSAIEPVEKGVAYAAQVLKGPKLSSE